MCNKIPQANRHYDNYISIVTHVGLWTLGVQNFDRGSETEELLLLRRQIQDLWKSLHELTYQEPRELIKHSINRLSKLYRKQLKLKTQSNFERWKEKCLKAEPRDRWRMVTRWTRPRTRTYNFIPFDVKNKAEEFWKGYIE